MATAAELRQVHHRVHVEHVGPRHFQAWCICPVEMHQRRSLTKATEDAAAHVRDMHALGARAEVTGASV